MIHSEGFSEAPTFGNCTANLNSKAGLYADFTKQGCAVQMPALLKKAGRGMRMQRKSLVYSRFRVQKPALVLHFGRCFSRISCSYRDNRCDAPRIFK